MIESLSSSEPVERKYGTAARLSSDDGRREIPAEIPRVGSTRDEQRQFRVEKLSATGLACQCMVWSDHPPSKRMPSKENGVDPPCYRKLNSLL